jgi:5'-deoxynucleotidase YfbR-like HD superfamily hydrolase
MSKTDSMVIRLFNEEEWQSISSTIRWNSIQRIKDESLRDHLFLCAMFGRIIVEELFSNDKPYLTEFKLETITSCMFHDFDEVFTGDILHHVKYNSISGNEIRQGLNKFVHAELQEKMFLNDDYPSQKMFLHSIFTNDKCVKSIVKVVDWLSCLHYVYSEKRLGNKNFDVYIEKCKNSLFQAIETSKYELSFRFPTDCNFKVYNEIKEKIAKRQII